MSERRTGYINNLGVAGALKRNEDDTVPTPTSTPSSNGSSHRAGTSSPACAIAASSSSPPTTSSPPAIPNDSGSIDYSKTTPVAGITFKVTPAVNVYGNIGRGFETPTFAELAYRADGTTGLNFALRPATSKHAEIGAEDEARPTRCG